MRESGIRRLKTICGSPISEPEFQIGTACGVIIRSNSLACKAVISARRVQSLRHGHSTCVYWIDALESGSPLCSGRGRVDRAAFSGGSPPGKIDPLQAAPYAGLEVASNENHRGRGRLRYDLPCLEVGNYLAGLNPSKDGRSSLSAPPESHSTTNTHAAGLL